MPSNESMDSLPADILSALRDGVDGKLSKEDFERLRSKVNAMFDDEAASPVAQAVAAQQDWVPFPANAPVGTFPGQPAPEDPYALTSWGQPAEQDFRCKSGQMCRVRRVDMMDLISGGLLNNIDFLTAMVKDDHIPNATGRPGEKSDSGAKALSSLGEENMAEFKKTIDAVVLRVVVRPQLWPIPPEGEARVDGCVYVDSVPMNDRMDIFNWAVTGEKSEQLKQFRETADQPVGTVEPVANLSESSVRPAGNN
jgi:hypothetical protein